jgi:uncharacterized protein (TIGR03437 family)
MSELNAVVLSLVRNALTRLLELAQSNLIHTFRSAGKEKGSTVPSRLDYRIHDFSRWGSGRFHVVDHCGQRTGRKIVITNLPRGLPFALLFFSIMSTNLVAQPERIHGGVDPSRTAEVRGHLVPRTRISRDEGQIPADVDLRRVTLVLKRSEAQQSELDRLLEAQQNPSSASFRKWLTPEEFADRFGLNELDIVKITNWLQSQGLKIEGASRSRSRVTFSGSAGQIGRALQTTFHYYTLAGERFYANSTEPSLPAAIQQVSLGIEGLNNLHPRPAGLWVAQTTPPPAAAGQQCDPSQLSGTLTPNNFATIYDVSPLYDLTPAITGAGQNLAIVGAVDPNAAGTAGTTVLQDVAAFRARYNLPTTAPAIETLLGGPEPSSVDVDYYKEADLDMEWAGAIARNAQIKFVFSDDAFTSAEYAIENMVAPIVSMSFARCEPEATGIEPNSLRALAQQGNAEGITWLAASGDAGAGGCDLHGTNPEITNGLAVSLPASIPEVTAVGGTEFDEKLAGTGACFWDDSNDALRYIPEVAWNDTAATSTLLASGGGASRIFTNKPLWQLGLGDNARDVPDISFAASGYHDGYETQIDGGLALSYGTSIATPSFAAVLTLLNQYLNSAGSSSPVGLGNVNPGLYALAVQQPAVFHDVTVGSTMVPCASGSVGCPAATKMIGFNAGPGYDQATGLGSLDVNAFVTAWTAGKKTTTTLASPTSLLLADDAQLTASVSVASATAMPTGTVDFVLGPTAANSSLTLLGSAPVANQGGVATANLLLTAGQLPPGSDTIQALYSGDHLFHGSMTSAKITVEAGTGNSAVAPSITPAPPVVEKPANAQGYNWYCTITLQEEAGVGTTLTKFTVAGAGAGATASGVTGTFSQDLSGSIAQMFGTATIPAGKSISATYGTNDISPPETVIFGFTGMDASGYAWYTTLTVPFNGTGSGIGSFVNAASYQGDGIAAPGMAITLFSTNYSASNPLVGNLANFIATGISTSSTALVSTLIGDNSESFLTASINGFPAPLFYVAPGQINLQIPYELESLLSATTTLTPAVLTLDSSGIMSSYSFNVQSVAPGIYANGVGNCPAPLEVTGASNSAQIPAPAGSFITVLYTGAGALSSSIADGAQAPAASSSIPSPPAPLSKATAIVSQNGQTMATLDSFGAAMTPGYVGVAQASFTLPTTLAAGNYDLQISLTGSNSTPALSHSVPLVVGVGPSNCAQ